MTVNVSSIFSSWDALVRLVAGMLLVAAGLLIVFEAPTHLLWMVELGVTEWGYWLVPVALFCAGWPCRDRWPAGASCRWRWAGSLGRLLAFIGALLFLSPFVWAWGIAEPLDRGLVEAFPVNSDSSAGTVPLLAGRSSVQLARLFPWMTERSVERRTLVYATPGGEPLELDLYRAANHSPTTPLVLVVHGGSWQGGDREQLSDLNRHLASRGYVVAAVSYRLAPRWPFPAARDDVRAALAYLKVHAGELGLDPHRVVLLGRSAGGQLALLVAYTAGDPAIRGAIAFYAPADLRYSYEHPGNPLVLDSRAVLTAYLGGSPAQRPETYEEASPLNFVGAETPPTLLIHGERDELVRPIQSERLADRLIQAGRPVFFLRLPWATHGCDVNFGGPCGQLSAYAVERFLAAVTR